MLSPEAAHGFVFAVVSRLTFLYPLFRTLYSSKESNSAEGIVIGDIKFRNRLGIAAGLDKDGKAIRFFDAIGFSHIEVGTVTPLPQPGNSKPRLFRLVKDKALINSMGFNNSGADELKRNILAAKALIRGGFVIGVNIGKNKNTPLDKAAEDYKICLEKLYDAADYFTINISSPNTEGLRDLQGVEYLDNLLSEIQKTNEEISSKKSMPLKNVFLKIAPDLEKDQIKMIFQSALRHRLTGIIATNTTLSREGLSLGNELNGGLSGKPLKNKSDLVLIALNDLKMISGSNIILIASGGVFTKRNYLDKIESGAELVQVYTGFIYEGAGIVKKILD